MKSWRQFRKAQKGLAAVEFALLLPVMITMFFGVVELSLALLCRADVSIMASTAADLIAQESTTQTSDLSNVYSAAGTVLYPYYSSAMPIAQAPTIRITSIVYNSATRERHLRHDGLDLHAERLRQPQSRQPQRRQHRHIAPGDHAGQWQHDHGRGRLQLCLADHPGDYRPDEHDQHLVHEAAARRPDSASAQRAAAPS